MSVTKGITEDQKAVYQAESIFAIKDGLASGSDIDAASVSQSGFNNPH